jgi:hypothetical protein
MDLFIFIGGKRMRELEIAAQGQPDRAAPQVHPAFNWTRFWIQSAVTVLVFNVVAGLMTWYWLFPRLFPGR